MSNDVLKEFLSNLDTLDDYCAEQHKNDGVQNVCEGCILNDYCLDVPTRSSFEAKVRAANKAVNLIRRTKEGEGYKKVTISDAQFDGGTK